jgi:CCR4-NOT transcription complex subunit 7/8
MPPPLQRFGPSNPYQQQFPSHAQSLSGSHQAHLGTQPSYLNPNAGINPFASNGNVLGLGGAGLSTGAGGFGVGADTGLASHAARMGFAHAGGLQQQQQQQHGLQQGHGALGEHSARGQAKGRIREVWKYNLAEELAILRELVGKYPYIAMVGHRSPNPENPRG